MSLITRLGLAVAAFFAIVSVTSGASADQYVHGYVRGNGTYVPPYYRSSPNGNPYDNYTLIPHLDSADRPERRGNAGETAESYFHPSRPSGFGRLTQRKQLRLQRKSAHGASSGP